MLGTKFHSNWRIFLFWQPFLVQNGHHSKPKWVPYGAACLTPCKYPFSLKSVHFWIFNDFFNFYIGGHFENFINKEHNFEWWSIFVSYSYKVKSPLFCCMATAAKFFQPIPIFLAYLIPLDVDVVPIKFHQFLFGE